MSYVSSMTDHQWVHGDLMYTSAIPQWDWRCVYCGTTIRCHEPPAETCPVREQNAINRQLM